MDELAVASIYIYKDAGLNLRRVFVVKDTAPICIGGVFIAFRIRPKFFRDGVFADHRSVTKLVSHDHLGWPTHTNGPPTFPVRFNSPSSPSQEVFRLGSLAVSQ